jgi:hypothetical protein
MINTHEKSASQKHFFTETFSLAKTRGSIRSTLVENRLSQP